MSYPQLAREILEDDIMEAITACAAELGKCGMDFLAGPQPQGDFQRQDIMKTLAKVTI